MDTTIIGFHPDELGDWVAELGCGHGQHMRHQPPWQMRPWVMTAEGREAKLGEHIECSLCDAICIPSGAREYKRTAVFTEASLPSGLLSEHRTKANTWGRIVVTEGRLDYHVRGRVQALYPGKIGIVEPEIPHRVMPHGTMRMHVEFWKED